jgi:predicted nucleic acid-binding protein
MNEISPTRRALVFDSSVLSAFAEADQLDMLGHYLTGEECYATDVVRDELRIGAATRPQLEAVECAEWLRRGELSTDAELLSFAHWATLLGSGVHDLGEASVFAYAAAHGSISVIDDRPATRVGRTYGLDVHGSLWLIAGFCRAGKLTEYAAARLIDALRSVGARLPCTGNEFSGWARRQGML